MNIEMDLLMSGRVGQDSHVTGGDPQFTDDVSVAYDHNQSRC